MRTFTEILPHIQICQRNIAKEIFKGYLKSLLLFQYAIKIKKKLYRTFSEVNLLGIIVTFKNENAICIVWKGWLAIRSICGLSR